MRKIEEKRDLKRLKEEVEVFKAVVNARWTNSFNAWPLVPHKRTKAKMTKDI